MNNLNIGGTHKATEQRMIQNYLKNSIFRRQKHRLSRWVLKYATASEGTRLLSPGRGGVGDTQGHWLAGEENRLESRGPTGRMAVVCVPSLQCNAHSPLNGNFFPSKGFQLFKFKVKNKPQSRSFSGPFSLHGLEKGTRFKMFAS